MSNTEFYQHVTPFTRFQDAADMTYYEPLPHDWCVVITDVKASGKAIDEGKYKAVNAISVAAITAMINALKPLHFPYVFAGDGVSACIPKLELSKLLPALAATRKLALEEFGLQLHMGAVAIDVIRAQGEEVYVAKFQPHEHYTQAMFMGQGIPLGESLIKSGSDLVYNVNEHLAPDATLFDGFECRWSAIPTPQEENVALLVEVRSSQKSEQFRIMHEIIEHIERHYHNEENYHPVRAHLLSLTHRFSLLKFESLIRMAFSKRHWLLHGIKLQCIALIGRLLMHFGVTTADTEWGHYKQQFIENSDYRKIDGLLRMLVSGTKAQRETLEAILKEYETRGEIYYGLHPTSSSLVTCIVTNYQSEHVHFLDGSHGGYTTAAKMLNKKKL